MKRSALVVSLVSALLLLWAGLAQAELVPGAEGASDAALAVALDGSPRVAFIGAGGSLTVASRTLAGAWAADVLRGLPGPRTVIVGFAVARDGAQSLLAEDAGGRWLALAERRGGAWRVRRVATAPRRGLLGFGGLALDRRGRPLVAYAYALASHKTWLRLVHEDRKGRLVGERVTRAGFPPSDVLPAATPVVLPSGAVRVVETYDRATIEWARTKNRKDWIGQLLYGSAIGSPAGVVQAQAGAGGVWSAWTELFPSFDESQLLLTLHRNGERTVVLHHHAYLVSLVLTSAGPEVAADDYVDVAGARTVFAGVVLDATGGSLELGGKLDGYATDAGGGRQYLLEQPDGLAWYGTAAAPAAHVELSAAVAGAAVGLSGSVTGGAGGSVELWRETTAGSTLVAAPPLGPDGTFAFTDTPPAGPVTYRAVYRDPASGLPLASLLRAVLGG